MNQTPPPEKRESSGNRTQLIWAIVFALLVVVLIGAMQAIDYYADQVNATSQSGPKDAADQ